MGHKSRSIFTGSYIVVGWKPTGSCRTPVRRCRKVPWTTASLRLRCRRAKVLLFHCSAPSPRYNKSIPKIGQIVWNKIIRFIFKILVIPAPAGPIIPPAPRNYGPAPADTVTQVHRLQARIPEATAFGMLCPAVGRIRRSYKSFAEI